MRKLLIALAFLLMSATSVAAQVVAQGAPAPTSDARAWPFKIVFGGVAVDPRDITDNANRILGKVTFGSAQPVTQSGAWAVSFTAPQHVIVDSSASVAVTGTFWQATQPVSGPLTDVQLRASAVPVDGSGVTQPVSGTVTVTDGAGALNVIVDSGTTTVTQGTGTNLHTVVDSGAITATGAAASGAAKSGNPVQIGGVFNTSQPTVTNGQAVEAQMSARGAQIVVPGTELFPVQATISGTVAVSNAGTFAVQDAAAEASLSVLDDWDESDRSKVNIIVGQAGIAAGTGVDGATVPRVSLATNVPLPAGTNAIGKLSANSGVDIGDVDVASVTGNVTVVQGTGTNLHVVVDSAPTTAVTNAGITTIAGAVAGTEMQVDVLTLPNVTVGTFPDNEPFNVAQINGVTPLMGNGATGTGSQRVTIADNNSPVSVKIDQTTPGTTNRVDVGTMPSVTIGTFPDNEPINVAQINGVAPTMGNGASGTGVQRVTLADDSTGRVSTKTALTANAPATGSVGVASAQIVAANASRKGLVVVNLSSATVCVGIAATAVLNSGICLQPSAVWNMNEYMLATGAINAIASAAASTVSIQEFQ